MEKALEASLKLAWDVGAQGDEILLAVDALAIRQIELMQRVSERGTTLHRELKEDEAIVSKE